MKESSWPSECRKCEEVIKKAGTVESREGAS